MPSAEIAICPPCGGKSVADPNGKLPGPEKGEGNPRQNYNMFHPPNWIIYNSCSL